MAAAARYVDTSFCEVALVGVGVQERRQPIQWRRIADVYQVLTQIHGSVAPMQLFGTIQAENIRQGELGDCWLLAAIAVMADFPGHIRNLFADSELNAEGRYAIQLYDILRGWTEIVIDDLIPCDKHGRPLFAQVHLQSGAFWVILLEKAFAKFCGGYKGLDGGGSHWAWQVLTGQPHQAMWARKTLEGGVAWQRFELSKLKESMTTEDGAAKWRAAGMKSSTWKGPMESLADEEMFKAMASYSQANYLVSCAINRGGTEEKRHDGLLCKHSYSLLQVISAYGIRLVQLRNPWGKGGEWNGAWGDDSPEWAANPKLDEDLCLVKEDDGRFWMPWDDFMRIFGGDVAVSPVTLPCPRNSNIASSEEECKKGQRCLRCKQPFTRSWVLLESGEWHRLGAGQLCFLCLRAACRARAREALRLAGVHSQPTLSFAPPPAPRRLQYCEYGAACYRRNPQHFRDFFHPSLLPPAPPCPVGCGRSAASGYPTCCKRCQVRPPDLQINVPSSCGRSLSITFTGRYCARPDKHVNGQAVWCKDGGTAWLWRGDVWMLGEDASDVGGKAGSIAGDRAFSPHLVQKWKHVADSRAWAQADIVVYVAPGQTLDHDELCDKRDVRERELSRQADALLGLVATS